MQQIKNKSPIKVLRTLFLKTLSFLTKPNTIFSHIVQVSLGKSVLTGKRTSLLVDFEPIEDVVKNCVEYTFVEPVKNKNYYIKPALIYCVPIQRQIYTVFYLRF